LCDWFALVAAIGATSESIDTATSVQPGFHVLVQLLFRLNIQDTQCGAKVMRREAVERIHSSLRIADVAFDINLLHALKRNGFTILEVPTEWTDKIGSKIKLNKGASGFCSPFCGCAWCIRRFTAGCDHCGL